MSAKIALSSRQAIVALHKLVFEVEGDRGNRKRLREFKGFTFKDESDEFNNKLAYAARLSIAELTSICNVLGLDFSGDKEELRIRIIKSIMDLNSLISNVEHSDDEDEDDDDEGDENNDGDDNNDVEEEEADGSDTGTRNQRQTADDSNIRFTMSFKDVEESIRPFNGSDNYSIERWILDFEDAAQMFKWTDLQKVVFAKKSLEGLAKLFVQSENGLKS